MCSFAVAFYVFHHVVALVRDDLNLLSYSTTHARKLTVNGIIMFLFLVLGFKMWDLRFGGFVSRPRSALL